MSNPSLLKRFRADESGAMGTLGLITTMGIGTVSAFALDVSYLMAAKSQLQLTADAAAHAAIYARDTQDSTAAKAAAVAVADSAMSSQRYGNVIQASDIEFGIWDRETSTFTADPAARDAVRVRTARMSERTNAAASIFFRFIGRESFDVVSEAVFTTYEPTCFTEGFIADGVVDIQSNNGFSNGFCIHSNTYVSVNSNNTFEPGTVVSMPDESSIDLPQSGFETNAGLEAALRSGVYRMRLLNRIDDIYDGLLTSDMDYVPDYITSTAPVPIAGTTLDETDFAPGHIYTHSCAGGGPNTLTLGNDAAPISNVVIMTDCKIKFSEGTIVEDAVITTTSTDLKSVTGPAGVQLGKDDSCAAGGGAQLLTYGGVDVAADLRMYGGQIVALQDVEFAANADGIEGASILSNGVITGTSNMAMGFCGSGMEDNFSAKYFRLAA